VDPGSDITVRSQEALKALDRLRTEVEATGDAEQEADQVEELRSKVDGLLPEGQGVEDLTDDPAVLDGMLIRSRALTSQSGTLIDRLTGSAERLEAVLKEIRALIGEWQRVREEATNVPEALNDRVTDIIGGAQELEMRGSSFRTRPWPCAI
jgi:hypothetical protein